MTDNEEPVESFLPLHPLEFRILLVLMEGSSHAYVIVQEIEARETVLTRIYPANLYRRVRDLLKKGMIEDVAPPFSEAGESRRRDFRITALGRKVVRAEAHRLKGLLGEAEGLGVLSTR